MRLESVSPRKFRKDFSTIQARTVEAIRACIRRPTPEAIHEARIAIRKLTTAVSLMPREFREDGKMVRTGKALRVLYTDCAKIRDIDAMTNALSNNVALGDLKSVMADLRERRTALASKIGRSGNEVKRLTLRRPTDDTRRRLRKRLNKILARRADQACDLYWVAASSEENLAELHQLRKECRCIMYLLDFANDDARVKSARLELEDARDKLGSIREDDVLLDFLRDTRVSAPVLKLISAVSAGRLTKYRKFFAGQTARALEPKLLESIQGLT
jgi:CHAD domain-containing protein